MHTEEIIQTEEIFWQDEDRRIIKCQVYMMTACIMPVFCFAKKNKAAELAVGLSFTNFFFLYNITVTNLLVDTLLPIVGMCALLYVRMYCDGEKKDRTALCLSAAMYVSYQIGMLGMYLFSMPGEEAASLAGSARYVKTILIALLYIALILFVKILADCSAGKLAAAAAAVAIFALPFAYMWLSMGTVRFALQDNDDSMARDWIEQTREEYAIPNGESYCVLVKNAGSAG